MNGEEGSEMVISRISLIGATAASLALSVAHAASTEFNSLSNAELLTRWNKQADWYDKSYVLEGCTDRKVPNTNRSFLLCDTAGKKGAVSFRRNAGQLESVEYVMKGHPPSDASMFVRFVRNARTGNMGAVGVELLTAAKKRGTACSDEVGNQVCTTLSGGEIVMAASGLKLP